jgi:hypothetical protein
MTWEAIGSLLFHADCFGFTFSGRSHVGLAPRPDIPLTRQSAESRRFALGNWRGVHMSPVD